MHPLQGDGNVRASVSWRCRDRGRHLVDGVRRKQHVPYRASRLTLFLKDCFHRSRVTGPGKTVVIAAVSPLGSDHSHSLNTLRYADRIKEHAVKDGEGPAASERKSGDGAPAVKINDPMRWGKKKMARWLAANCCEERMQMWSNVTGKKVCHMMESEIAYRCSRHAGHIYKTLGDLRASATLAKREVAKGRGLAACLHTGIEA